MMKGFKVTNIAESKQVVNLPPGIYTYSCKVIPVSDSCTFKIDNQEFTFDGLTAGVLSGRIKHTFELTETGVEFYLSNKVGDCIYEPQIEEGSFDTTPGPHQLDFERLISEAGIEIDHEALSLYAKKADVSAEIKIQADQINSTVRNISNDVDGLKGSVTSITQTVDSITATVSNHTSQISTFQQTVDDIYLAIEDVGSGEFASILMRLDSIETKVGNQSQQGSIMVAMDNIALRVSDTEAGYSQIEQTVNSISSTVYDVHGELLSQISQDEENILIKAEQVELEGLITANENFEILEDGSIVANNGEFKGGIKQPFVDVSESTVENFWNTSKTSWACNFFEENPFSSLTIRVIPCRPVLNGQIFRFHARRRGIILQPEVAYKFYENGASLNEITLAAGEAIEMISVSIDNVFKSWDIIRRYKCRKYNE